MRHSRKPTRVISFINQLQSGINVNEENQPLRVPVAAPSTC